MTSTPSPTTVTMSPFIGRLDSFEKEKDEHVLGAERDHTLYDNSRELSVACEVH
ncbi:hypothetical protein DPMN_159121 [Dreissena polymorpha]|uniref:Uncharacterized protein n=1 Tax=Dreissena polymorpha TaxID=45954 RepID=A0A9D4IQF2_DREPO|nr:hypothetical protein DPMN_159121 [Dreissena polymorpha]